MAAGIAANGIVWTPYGKIRQITNATYRIEYLYDAMGNRVRQKRTKLSDNTYVTTYYGRDASGKNVIGTYEKIGTGSTVLKEVPLYGSSRLGILRPNATQSTTAITPPAVYTRTLGKKEYEITDHLGNVRVSVSDRLVKPGSDWLNDVKMQTDYFPYGMQREDRNDNVAGYRYGYNGKENDNDVKGEGNQQDYGFRIYDPRIARFLSVDPLTAGFPMLTPYQFASNRPIDGVDLDGKEYDNFMSMFKKPGDLRIQLPNVQTAQRQHYSITVADSKKSFQNLKKDFIQSADYMLSNDKADFNKPVDGEGNPAGNLAAGKFVHININGPQNDSWVKVVDIHEQMNYLSFTFVTLEGHVEAGRITFRLYDLGDNKIQFTINSISDVDMTLAPEGTSREKQRESWRNVLERFRDHTSGKVVQWSDQPSPVKPSDNLPAGQTNGSSSQTAPNWSVSERKPD